MTEIRIGATVIATERDTDTLGRIKLRRYRGVVIGMHPDRRWALVAYRVGGACLRGGFAFEDIKVTEVDESADRTT